MAWGRKPRRFGTWYVAEHMVRAMRAYGWTIVVGALGQPILYLLGLAVGLAALIDAPIDRRRDRGLVPRVRGAGAADDRDRSRWHPKSSPTRSCSGFKWRRYFFGFGASAALEPVRSPRGVVVGASVRMLFVVAAYYVFIWLFGAVPDAADRLADDPDRTAGRARLRHPATWRTRHPSPKTKASSRSCSGSSSCRCSCSPARSTRSPRCRSGCSGSGGSRRSGTRPSSAGWSRTGKPIEPLMVAIHLGYLHRALGGRRTCSAGRFFERRLAK